VSDTGSAHQASSFSCFNYSRTSCLCFRCFKYITSWLWYFVLYPSSLYL